MVERMRGNARKSGASMPAMGSNAGRSSSGRKFGTQLDLSTVEREHNYSQKDSASEKRLFGLQDCPTYRPSEDEFHDPLSYIQKIAPEGKQYGIVKIIPPTGWRPDFRLDTRTFRFKTRKQTLNSMEARCRASLNYIDQVFNFHAQRGKPLRGLPSIDGKPINLWSLRDAVTKNGGYQSLATSGSNGSTGDVKSAASQAWIAIGIQLGLNAKLSSEHAPTLKAAYERTILPYEDFVARTKAENAAAEAAAATSATTRSEDACLNTPPKRERGSQTPDASSPTDPVDKASSAETPTETRGTRLQSKLKRRADAIAARSSTPSKKVATKMKKLRPGEDCEVCGRGDDEKQMLLCDGCENGYHTFCLDPPLQSIPKVDWYCPQCLVGRGEFGFEDGGVYTLADFQAKANAWKAAYFQKQQQRNPDQFISANSEDFVEREFWRLVQDVEDDTEVEYGADIHSTVTGSAFATLERFPLDKYAIDPWNLNNIAKLDNSLLRYVKGDLDGMIVPWLYVGMCFSTFCWHNEDHYTYSINYQHFGETKTWYGIPGSDAHKFEEVMRKAVPDLFEQQPDLLLQLVTILSPELLRKEGVNVFSCNQHANEFIVTFPQAYHAGFNQGFNFNEAVNFATPDWMAEGYSRECVARYQTHSRQPVFSHDELLLIANKADQSIKTAQWLAPALTEMVERELKGRATVRSASTDGLRETVIDREQMEDGYMCGHCKTYCYLSQIACACTSKVTCLDHADRLCDCDASRRSLRVRQTDSELQQIQRTVSERANMPEAWKAKLASVLQKEERPALKTLRALASEGERIAFPIKEVITLKKFIARANEWIDQASAFTTKKTSGIGRRKSEKLKQLMASRDTRKSADAAESNGRKDSAQLTTDGPAKLKRDTAQLERLLALAETLAFSCTEITTLREKAAAVQAWQSEADSLAKTGAITPADCQRIIDRGEDLNVEIPFLDRFKIYQKQVQWLERVRPALETTISLTEVAEMWLDGQACGVPETSLEMYKLQHMRDAGEAWEAGALTLLKREEEEKLDLADVDDWLSKASSICTKPETLANLQALRQRLGQVEDEARAMVLAMGHPNLSSRPTLEQARIMHEKAIASSLQIPDLIHKLEEALDEVHDWLKPVKRIFGKANAPQETISSHLDYVAKHNAVVLDLDDVYRDPVEPSSRENTPEPRQTEQRPDVFCLCRKPEAGLMLECDVCHEWYHCRCLKILKKDVKGEDDRYICPVCDWRKEIPRIAHRPSVEALQALLQNGKQLPLQLLEVDKLDFIVSNANAFRARLRPFLSSFMSLTSAELPTLKFYLRKIEGAEVLLREELNFFRSKVHELYPIADTPPPSVTESKTTRKPRLSKKKREELIAQGIDPATWIPPSASKADDGTDTARSPSADISGYPDDTMASHDTPVPLRWRPADTDTAPRLDSTNEPSGSNPHHDEQMDDTDASLVQQDNAALSGLHGFSADDYAAVSHHHHHHHGHHHLLPLHSELKLTANNPFAAVSASQEDHNMGGETAEDVAAAALSFMHSGGGVQSDDDTHHHAPIINGDSGVTALPDSQSDYVTRLDNQQDAGDGFLDMYLA